MMYRQKPGQTDTDNQQHQGTVDPLPLRGRPPKPSSGLNKRAVAAAIAFTAVLLFIALIDGLSSGVSSNKTGYRDDRRASLGDAIRKLPSSYSDILRDLDTNGLEVKATPAPPQAQPSAIDKYNEEQRLARLKEQALARKADVSFSGINLPMRDSKSGGGSATRDLPQLNAGAPGSAISSNPRDDFNRQDDKHYFLNHPRTKESLLVAPLLSPFSEQQLMAGSIIPGLLLTGINSDLPGKLLAQISQNIFDTAHGKHLLIPQGTKVVGEYDSRIVYGQERVLIVWTRLIFPNGKSIALEGMPGIDLSGYAGLSERVNHHYGRLLSGVVFGSVIGAGAQVARGSNRTMDPTFGQLALGGAAQNINRAGQQITEKNLNIQPTIEVSPGHRFNIFVTKDIILEAYEQ